jgi:hypothetical protein
MNELLTTRYQSLFQSYAAGGTDTIASFKRQIADWKIRAGNRVRWDAALMLLVNLDHMIIRPYFGDILTENNATLALPNQYPISEWRKRAQMGLNVVLDYLAQNGEEISSHDVLKATAANWQLLSEIFAWG